MRHQIARWTPRQRTVGREGFTLPFPPFPYHGGVGTGPHAFQARGLQAQRRDAVFQFFQGDVAVFQFEAGLLHDFRKVGSVLNGFADFGGCGYGTIGTFVDGPAAGAFGGDAFGADHGGNDEMGYFVNDLSEGYGLTRAFASPLFGGLSGQEESSRVQEA